MRYYKFNRNTSLYYEQDKMKYYAFIIQKLQHEFGLKISSFPDLGMSPLSYFADNAGYSSEPLTAQEREEIMKSEIDLFRKLRDSGEVEV